MQEVRTRGSSFAQLVCDHHLRQHVSWDDWGQVLSLKGNASDHALVTIFDLAMASELPVWRLELVSACPACWSTLESQQVMTLWVIFCGMWHSE